MTVETQLEIRSQGFYNEGNGYMTEAPRATRQANGGGIKRWEGSPAVDTSFAARSISVDDLRDTTKVKERVWRPEETLEAAGILSREGRVMIIGDPQAGKGTILYGVSSMCDIAQVSYMMVDGHWLDTSGERVVEAIELAGRRRDVIFYDSFDYLFAATGRLRKASVDVHRRRTSEIIHALSDVQVPLVLTAHGDTWAEYFLSPEMLSEHDEFLSRFDDAKYHLPRQMASETSCHIFLVDHEYSDLEADTLLNLASNPVVVDSIVTGLGDKRYIEEMAMAVLDFPTLKSLARERSAETRHLLKRVENGDKSSILPLCGIVMDQFHESNFLANLRRWK